MNAQTPRDRGWPEASSFENAKEIHEIQRRCQQAPLHETWYQRCIFATCCEPKTLQFGRQKNPDRDDHHLERWRAFGVYSPNSGGKEGKYP